MSERVKSLSAEAQKLFSSLKEGLVLWFSDAGEYPDRFWVESAEGEGDQTGQLANMSAVLELREQGLIEPDSGDSYRQRWRLAAQGE